MKISTMEIFSSPTNQGCLYAAVVLAKNLAIGQRLEPDPLKWNYHYLGASTDFNFIPPSNTM